MLRPPGTWLEFETWRSLGSVEFVCAPSRAARWGVILQFFAFGLAVPVMIVTIGTLCLINRMDPGFFCVLSLMGWVVGLSYVIRNSYNRLDQRLVVGQHGLALASRSGLIVVLWDDLGNLCQVQGTPGAGSLLLSKIDGTRVEITPFFEHSEEVIARVRTEYNRRAGLALPAASTQEITTSARTRTPTTPLPAGPWLDSVAAQSIGPLERVCAPAWGEVNRAVAIALLIFLLLPIPLALLTFFACVALSGAGAGHPEVIWIFFFVSWIGTALVFLWLGLAKLRERLLLGARGIALWTESVSTVIPWEDLGTAWRRRPAVAGSGALAVILEHADGRHLPITVYFGEHHIVALRVLEELAKRLPEREPDKLRPSEGIKPAERGVRETENEQP
jgi:hypothetical protein